MVNLNRRTTNTPQIRILPLLTVPFLVEITLAVGIVGFISYRNGQNAVEEVVQQLHGEISDRIEQRIDIYLVNPHLINQINADAYRLNRLRLEEPDNLAELERYFWNQLSVFRDAELENITAANDNDKSLNSIYFGNKSGQFFGAEYNSDENRIDVSRSDLDKGFITYPADSEGRPKWDAPNEQKAGDKDYDPRTRPWYEAAESFEQSWSEIYLDTSSGSPAITASLAIRDDDDNLTGVLASDLLLSEIVDFMNSLKIGNTGEVFIFDVDQEKEIDEETGDWELVVTSKEEEELYTPVTIQPKNENEKPKEKLNRLIAIESKNPVVKGAAQHLQKQSEGEEDEIDFQNISTFQSNGNRYFLKVTPISDNYGLNWYMAVVIPESDFLSKIYRNNIRTIILCVITLVIATIVSLYTSKEISKPILELTDFARRRREASSDEDIEMRNFENPYEIATLAQTLIDSFDDLERTNAAYERFVPKNFLKILNTENITDVNLGDSFVSENRMSILFSDIRSFTELSERMEPEESFQFINQYFGVLAPRIRHNHGFIDKYIGDAIMALFDGEDNANNAVRAAVEMQRALDLLNNQNRDIREPVGTGIGVHTGQLILGTVGTDKRMDSTVIGREVNRASRLEGLTKDYNARILISGQTFDALVDRNSYLERYLGKVRVKGVDELLRVYEIFNEDSERENKIRSKELFENGARLFDQAYELEFQDKIEEIRDLTKEDKRDLAEKARGLYYQSAQAFEQAMQLYPADTAARHSVARCEEGIARCEEILN
ncbi:MAG: adenylate/guanylate cyclase domain-containing protein [Elainellaceae cyanobacterium]